MNARTLIKRHSITDEPYTFTIRRVWAKDRHGNDIVIGRIEQVRSGWVALRTRFATKQAAVEHVVFCWGNA